MPGNYKKIRFVVDGIEIKCKSCNYTDIQDNTPQDNDIVIIVINIEELHFLEFCTWNNIKFSKLFFHLEKLYIFDKSTSKDNILTCMYAKLYKENIDINKINFSKLILFNNNSNNPVYNINEEDLSHFGIIINESIMKMSINLNSSAPGYDFMGKIPLEPINMQKQIPMEPGDKSIEPGDNILKTNAISPCGISGCKCLEYLGNITNDDSYSTDPVDATSASVSIGSVNNQGRIDIPCGYSNCQHSSMDHRFW